MMISRILFSILCFLSKNSAYSEEDPPGNKFSLPVPQLTEEDSESTHMPQHYKCDACLAITHQIHELFIRKKAKKPKLKEYEIIEEFENLCSSGFHDYGVKQVDGVNRLSGPGLESERSMAMVQMGGKWPYRLQEMCHNYVGEAGETEIYELFEDGLDKLRETLCNGKGAYGHCRQPPLKVDL